MSAKSVERVDRVVIRFAGDSGDGMQLTGDRFTAQTANLGNDLATLPNFPAEIRAPRGTLPGVSSFQLQFADHDVMTPGDQPDVLVAMNPAALRANLADLPRGAVIIADADEFTARNLHRVGYGGDPLHDGTLDSFRVHALPLTSMTVESLRAFDITRKEAERAKNMFALGLVSWLYTRPTEPTERFLRARFARTPALMEANRTAFRAGWAFGETTEAFAVSYEIAPAPSAPGLYRNITGNVALAYGLVTAAHRAGIPLVLGSYPITPASDILHALSRLKRFDVTTIQAEDEIAGIGAALGAAYGGAIGVTTTSGPGLALKSETIGLAVSLELPLVVVDVQRGGPSTGLPTKTEQADLLQAMFGRNGEAPVPVIAPPLPRRLLRLRDGGGADRDHLPHPGAAAVRRLPRERVGAVAGAPPGGPARTRGGVRHHPQRRHRRRPAGLPPLRPRPDHAGPPVGGARHARSRASHRRDREGRRDRRDLLRPGQP